MPVANLSPENIKEGVNVGGVIGELQEMGKICIFGRASLGRDSIICTDTTTSNNDHQITPGRFVGLAIHTGGSGGQEYIYTLYINHGLDVDSTLVYQYVKSNESLEGALKKVNADSSFTCTKQGSIYTVNINWEYLNAHFQYNKNTGNITFTNPTYYSDSRGNKWGLMCGVLYNS